MAEKTCKERTTDIKTLVIGDIDGVVANPGDRLRHISGEKNWDRFYGAEMANDSYIKQNGDLLQKLSFGEDAQLLFLTGRPERTHELTRLWLNEHLGGVVDYWMTCRHDDDHRKSPIVKAEMLREFLTHYEEILDPNMIVFLFDDDPDNLKAMEEVLNEFKFGYEYETYTVGTGRI